MRLDPSSVPVLHLEHGRTVQIYCDKVSAPDAPISLLRGVRPPHVGGNCHVHETETEIFIGISGTGTLVLDGQACTVEPGTVVWATPGVSHELRNDGDEEFSYYALFTPSISLEHIRENARRLAGENSRN